MTHAEQQAILKRTRKIAADSLYTVLKNLLKTNKPISEIILRDAWLAEIQKNNDVFSDGWYIPPPHGVTVLFATDKNVSRVTYDSLRPKEMWPRNDIFLDTKNGIAYLFACPVDKQTGIIGDFQTTLYFGENDEIKQFLESCLSIDKEIFQFAQVGMKLSEIAHFAENLLQKNGMTNEVLSITDKTGANIGHIIPKPQQEWNEEEQNEFQKGETNWDNIKDIINKKRIFTNIAETYVLQPGDAFTIEPRPRVLSMPQLPVGIGYHTVALFKESGEKELVTNFDNLFQLIGMNYMLK